MKWYFASNSESVDFFPLIKAAVLSARKNTTLEPHFIYDGSPDTLTAWLEEHGVKIIYHRSSVYDTILKSYPKKDLRIPAGAYLRCDIPEIETEDEFVLYTDCDVLFLKDITLETCPTPQYFSCSSQFEKKDFVDFNTGVMFMNVPALRESQEDFRAFIRQNMCKLDVLDQSAFQIFYGSKNSPLDIKYNHKPYWGVDEEAVILHFHGPKPHNFSTDLSVKNLHPTYDILYHRSIAGYKFYLELFKNYSNEIDYDYNAIELLNSGAYPYPKRSVRPFKVRLRNFLRKKWAKIKNFFGIN